MKSIVDNWYKYLVGFTFVYGVFQYGRIYDDKRCIVSQPEYNHFVYTDRCEIITDSTGQVMVVVHDNMPYVAFINSNL